MHRGVFLQHPGSDQGRETNCFKSGILSHSCLMYDFSCSTERAFLRTGIRLHPFSLNLYFNPLSKQQIYTSKRVLIVSLFYLFWVWCCSPSFSCCCTTWLFISSRTWLEALSEGQLDAEAPGIPGRIPECSAVPWIILWAASKCRSCFWCTEREKSRSETEAKH